MAGAEGRSRAEHCPFLTCPARVYIYLFRLFIVEVVRGRAGQGLIVTVGRSSHIARGTRDSPRGPEWRGAEGRQETETWSSQLE